MAICDSYFVGSYKIIFQHKLKKQVKYCAFRSKPGFYLTVE